MAKGVVLPRLHQDLLKIAHLRISEQRLFGLSVLRRHLDFPKSCPISTKIGKRLALAFTSPNMLFLLTAVVGNAHNDLSKNS